MACLLSYCCHRLMSLTEDIDTFETDESRQFQSSFPFICTKLLEDCFIPQSVLSSFLSPEQESGPMIITYIYIHYESVAKQPFSVKPPEWWTWHFPNYMELFFAIVCYIYSA